MTMAAAPRSAAPSAIARPSPLEPPVTTATKPSRSPCAIPDTSTCFAGLIAELRSGDTHSFPWWRGDRPAGKECVSPLSAKSPGMDDTHLTQLGRQVDAPASSEAAVLERVPNTQAGKLDLARFTVPW